MKGGKYSVLNPVNGGTSVEVFEVQKCLLAHQVSALLAAWLCGVYLSATSVQAEISQQVWDGLP